MAVRGLLLGIARVDVPTLSGSSTSPSHFAREYLSPRRPCILKSLIGGEEGAKLDQNPYRWPAFRRWASPPTLHALVNQDTEHLLVPVEISEVGSGYNAPAGVWERIQMPFGLFLEAFVHGRIPWQSGESRERIGYLAQFDLLSASPSLRAECPSLPHTQVGPKGSLEQWQSNSWIGPAGSFTPIHRDPYENIFVQVVGRKRVHLFPPSSAPLLSLQKTGTQTNTSTLFREDQLLNDKDEEIQRALTEASEVLVEAGDALYIPTGWFHCVQSLSVSASVNFWFR